MKNLIEHFVWSEDLAVIDKSICEHLWTTVGENVNAKVWDDIRDNNSGLVRASVVVNVYELINADLKDRQL